MQPRGGRCDLLGSEGASLSLTPRLLNILAPVAQALMYSLNALSSITNLTSKYSALSSAIWTHTACRTLIASPTKCSQPIVAGMFNLPV